MKNKTSNIHSFFVSFFNLLALLATASIAQAQYGEHTLGTLIVIPKFDIRQSSSTQFRIINHGEAEMRFKYNYVCPGIPHINDFCAKLDRQITLTPHETKVIDVASQNPPCNQGFIVGYPISEYGRALSYNYFSGSYSISDGRRKEMDTAIAIRSILKLGAELGADGNYDFSPGFTDYFEDLSSIFVTDFRSTDIVPNCSSGSRIVLLDLGSLLGMQNPLSTVFIDFWNSAEEPFSSSLQFICWGEYELSDIDDNFLQENLGTTYGSLRVEAAASCPLPGFCPPITPYKPLVLGVIQEYGEDTRALRSLARIPVPSIAPTPYQDESDNS